MAKLTLKEQNQELRAEIARLTLKLRTQIASANRLFEQVKLLETERRQLLHALAEHGIDMKPAVSQMGLLRDRFLQLAGEHSMANVRIIRGHIELRRDGEWVEVQ